MQPPEPARRARTVHTGWLFVCLLVPGAAGSSVDTVLQSNGGGGPYVLGVAHVDSSTLRAWPAGPDSTASLPFVFDPGTNTLLFQSPPDSGTLIRVRYETDYLGLPHTLSLYPKTYFDTSAADSGHVRIVTSGASLRSGAGALDVEGYKSIGVSLGSTGSTALE
jgi:hypothetical protein